MDWLWTPWRYAYVSDDKPARAGVPPALAAWPGDTGCLFCNILAATAYAVDHGMKPGDADRAVRIVARGPLCFVMLNAFPYTSGHCMIVPYAHLDALHALPTPAAQEFMQWAQRIDAALRQVYQPDGINMGLNLGKAAGAGVAGHLHQHCLPRWFGDTNFLTVASETRIMPEELDTSWQRLRAALS
jgi:ATP adenylyltransferase